MIYSILKSKTVLLAPRYRLLNKIQPQILLGDLSMTLKWPFFDLRSQYKKISPIIVHIANSQGSTGRKICRSFGRLHYILFSNNVSIIWYLKTLFVKQSTTLFEISKENTNFSYSLRLIFKLMLLLVLNFCSATIHSKQLKMKSSFSLL